MMKDCTICFEPREIFINCLRCVYTFCDTCFKKITFCPYCRIELSYEKLRKKIVFPDFNGDERLLSVWLTTIKVGDLITAKDCQHNWHCSTILDIREEHVKVHYNGWNIKYDAWIKKNAENILPRF